MPTAATTRSLVCSMVLLSAAVSAYGQMHKVEKPERVTRAIGVYEWTGDLKKPTTARLVPVSLFLDNHFQDAGVYLARPVPFTLESGDVYSIERAGESLGLLDVKYARDIVTRHAVADDDPVGTWYGYGNFSVPEPPKTTNLKVSTVKSPVLGGDSGDDQPHFVVRAGAEDTGAATKTSIDKTSGTSASPAPNPAPDDDPDRPTLRHRDPKPETKGKKQKEGGSVIPMGTSLNDDPDRPVLHRGEPESEFVPKQLTGIPQELHQAVAVSDPVNRDPHIFTRDWESPQERAQTLQDVQALARPMIATYLATFKLQPVAAQASGSGPSFASKPPTLKPTKKASAIQPPAPPAFSLTDEALNGYELSYGGLPTFIYTAQVPVAVGGPVYLTMVTQRLPSGELQVALSSVTDASHLDVTPWMRPVDVVDPDDSHRASLLMELRAQTGRQFALYRLVTAKAEQEFVTGIIE